MGERKEVVWERERRECGGEKEGSVGERKKEVQEKKGGSVGERKEGVWERERKECGRTFFLVKYERMRAYVIWTERGRENEREKERMRERGCEQERVLMQYSDYLT